MDRLPVIPDDSGKSIACRCKAAVNGDIPRRRSRVPGGIAAAALLLMILIAPLALHAQQVYVNPGVSQVPDDRQTLRAIFSMRLRQWPDGTPITVFVLPTANPVHVGFCKEVLGVFPHQLQRAWDRLVYSGTGQAPVEVDSLEEMRQRVKQTPGAIGYLKKDTDE